MQPERGARAAVLRHLRRHLAQDAGCTGSIPFYTRKRISLRIRSFESAHLKVNDKEGNPIEIGAVVVWKVVDTAEATFEVDNYEAYVRVQSESALRNAATSYPYDSHDEPDVISLRGSTAVVAEHLKEEMQQRLQKAGVEVIETRISHLAYAPEIAAAMLQRQQAGAIIAARQRIVEGAVGHGGNGARLAVEARRRAPRRGAQGRDGEQPAGRAVRREGGAAGRERRDHLPVTGAPGPVAERKSFLLRADAAVLEAMQRWANDDLRSLNAQVEFVLRDALRAAGRLPAPAALDVQRRRMGR